MAKLVSPAEAKALVEQGFTYVDVRSTQEFEAGHPAGAVHVALMERGAGGMAPNPRFLELVTARFPKDSKLVLGCEAGGRSARAAAVLEANGYTELADQRAGFGGRRDPAGRVVEPGWRDAGLPVATGKS